MISGLSCTAGVVSHEFFHMTTVPRTEIRGHISGSELHPQLANLPSVLGDGLLLSKSQDRAIVHVLSDSSPILRDVITTVLNDTEYVNLHFSLHGQDSFFLVQPDQKRVQEDWDQLQRLGTMFNVTMHAGEGHVDLRLRSPAILLNIRYGGSLEEERKRLLSHARKKAIKDAWQREIKLVQKGLRGSREWTKAEKEDLLTKGVVTDYYGTDIHDVEKFPQLADDPTNIVFRKCKYLKFLSTNFYYMFYLVYIYIL